jgi:hypothetical protein
MAGLTPYTISTDKVALSFDWGLSACDYEYVDVNKATGKPSQVKVDFQDLMVRVGSRRAAVVEGEIAPMATRMRSRNAYLADLGTVLSLLTSVQSSYSGEDPGSKDKDISLTADQYNILQGIDAAKKMIHYDSGRYHATKAEYEGLVQAVKGEMDKENNMAQTDMTRLQSLVDARDDSYSTTTNIMSAISDTRSNLIGNL